MIKDFKSLVGAKILEYSSGQVLGLVSGVVIHPDTGVVEAFWVKPLTLPIKSAVLKASDVLEFKKHLYIKDDRVLAQANDIIRINEILDDGREFLGANVVSETGAPYGKCTNLTFDTVTYLLKQIYVQRVFLSLYVLDERIFSYGDIIRVLPGEIIVNDDIGKKETLLGTTPEAAAS